MGGDNQGWEVMASCFHDPFRCGSSDAPIFGQSQATISATSGCTRERFETDVMASTS